MATENISTLMNPEEFQKLFLLALADKHFQHDLMTTGIDAAKKRGFNIHIPPEINIQLMVAVQPGRSGKYRCGVCGVCGTCGLCGGANLGSASAALWALFALSETTVETEF